MKGLSVLPVFRCILEEITTKINTPFLHYVNGLSLLSDASGLSADLVHPSPEGANTIAKNLINILKNHIR
jgi:lysophospholipase L1-like esterase